MKKKYWSMKKEAQDLYKQRKALGLTQKDMAAHLGWSQSKYSLKERGFDTNFPRRSTALRAMAKAIEIWLEELNVVKNREV